MGKIKANRQSLIRWKIYIDRARMYIGYAQFFMIVFVFLETFRDTNLGGLIFNHLLYSIPILFILFIISSLLLGRLDTVLGFREEELRNSSSSNPVMRDIQENMKAMRIELEELRNQNANKLG